MSIWMLKKSTSFVLRRSEAHVRKEYDSPLPSLRPRWTAFLSILLERILGAAKAGAAWTAVHRAPVSIGSSQAHMRFEPGPAAHRFDRPARRPLRVS